MAAKKRTIALVLALTVSAPLLLADQSARAQDDEVAAMRKRHNDYRSLQRQGVHYAKKKLWTQAADRLERALKVPGKDKEFRTLHILAKVYYEQLILEKAFPVAKRAVEAAETDAEKKKAEKFMKTLESRFGGVRFQKAPEQKDKLKKGLIHLEDKGGLINAQKKKQFQHISERFRKTPVELPLTVYLPFGKYTANRSSFEVKKGEIAEATLFLYNPDEVGGISPWWYVGGGLLVAGGTAAAILLLTGDESPEEIPALEIGRIGFRDGAEAPVE